MALYKEGDTVYAGKEMVTSACGDHPTLFHAAAGDELLVLEYRPERQMNYLVKRPQDPDNLSFLVEGHELMGQKPFSHNLSTSMW